MKERQIVMQKNPVVRTGKWAVNLTKNKLIASLMLLVQGILFIAAPQGNMSGTVQIAAGVVIAACAVNILLHLMQKNKGANATVTVVHSGTPDLARFTRDADILIAAIGKPSLTHSTELLYPFYVFVI